MGKVDFNKDSFEDAKLRTIKVAKLMPNAVLPKKAYDSDAAYDITAADCYYDAKHDNWVYRTGIAIEMPKGYQAFIYPRSSNVKKNAYMPNSVGIVDNSYRGEILIHFKNRDINQFQQPYNVGDRIAQMVIQKIEDFNMVFDDELSDGERGTNGHGSTGK